MYKYLMTTIAFAVAAAYGAIPLQSQPSWTWETAERAYGGLALADVDDDGDLDLVAGCYDGSNWYPPITDYHNMVFYNDGGKLGTSPGWTSSLERHTAELDTGDINGDGLADVFAANGGTSYQPNSVYYGKKAGPNTSPDWSSAQPAWATGSCLGDVDGDGYVDAATSNEGRNSSDPYRPVYIFWNTGSGLGATAGWRSSDQGVFSGVCLGDVDGADFTPVKGEKLQGDGSRQIFYLKHAPFLRIDAVRLDGRPLNAAYAYDLYAGWVSFCRPLRQGETAEVDYTYSKKLDLAVAKWVNFDTCVYFNTTGTPNATPGWTSGNPSKTDRGVIFFDYDRDGDQDLLVAGSNDYLRIYANDNGKLGTTPAWTSSGQVRVNEAAIGDFNGDGYQDVVIANHPYRGVSVWENKAGAIAKEPTWQYTGSQEVRAIAVGDVNGDGALDLAAGFSRKPLALFLNDYTVDVKVTAFQARGGDARAVVTWRAEGARLAGFDLLRRSGEGRWTCVNAERITGRSPYRFEDRNLEPGEYNYKLIAYDLSGWSREFGPTKCDVGTKAHAFALYAAYPNPARGAVNFSFSLPTPAYAELAVYDLAGRRVATPARGDFAAGEHKVKYEVDLTPGVYVYRLEAGGLTAAKRLAVVK